MIDLRRLILGFAIVALPVAVAAWYFQPAERWPDPGPMISVLEAHRKMDTGQMTMIDIRTPDEWRETGIARGAHAVTMHQDRKAFIARVREIAAKAEARKIGLICHSGWRSAEMLVELGRAGFPEVVNVAEGMVGGRYGPGWIRTGLPVEPAPVSR